ncbi:MAG: aldo/keto reductase [Gammaproteobacteria bacterium]|nr:aldo/keto reductase [Rhodocyclaceae bacterium]MBU3908693.1 aldo/keto reductase [Gammaproteobacteria bacterium]MBU3990757.1 aldo/keto reductase [Gammaproteobacteria bacterium]MBU4004721.1 aldo/keto reductase [Gammaproteobacteria bacterium]MBU4021324.1 aldo/keto reductase [Gammaproteobacteria bacterium]
METRLLGSSSLVVTPICLGTMTFGEQTAEPDAHAQLDLARERGINFIDTAELYAVPARAETYGATETIVGNWLKRQDRERVIVATKVAGPARTMPWIRGGTLNYTRANLRAALDASLRRLQTDYVDLYQLHWPDRNQPMFGDWQYDPENERDSIPIKAQLEALAELVAEGKIRAIGLSNEHPWGVMEFVRHAEEFGLPRVASIQNAYNLINRTYDVGLAEVCHRERVGLLAYSPLAFGLLTGKYLDNPRVAGRFTSFSNFGQRYDKPGVAAAVAAYCSLAREHGLTPTQLALAFMRSRWCVASTIVGASSVTQLAEDLDACEIKLDEEVLTAIDRLYLLHGNAAP